LLLGVGAVVLLLMPVINKLSAIGLETRLILSSSPIVGSVLFGDFCSSRFQFSFIALDSFHHRVL
jgi:hypothetical protein